MHQWIADRAKTFDSSGIRKMFELARTMKNPINFSIGQPDFDVPEVARTAAIQAIQGQKNGYSPSQGIPALQDALLAQVREELPGQADRKLFVTSGTSGGLVLAMMTLVNPGDEVIVFDPYFVMYVPLIRMMGGTPILIDTHPDFKIDVDRVASAITPKTKAILFNSPANPTGVVPSEAEVKGLAELAHQRGIALISDEIYRVFCYNQNFHSPAKYNPDTIVIDGFSKSYAMTGWRVGFMHGPAAVMDELIKMQQYTFVCAPQPAQWACLEVLGYDMSPQVEAYRKKRDLLLDGLQDLFEIVVPEGAFYMYPAAPKGKATEFVQRALEQELLIIPGTNFSKHDSHFRISYATDEATIARGIEVLRRLAKSS